MSAGVISVSSNSSEIKRIAEDLATQMHIEVDRDLEFFLEKYADDVSGDDFELYSKEDVARLALDLWSMGQTPEAKKPDGRAIRVRDCIVADDRKLPRTLIEAVGPDSSFLVDSAIATVVAGGFEIRAIAHPIAECDRTRLSFIQIHTDHLDSDQRKRLKAELEQTFSDVAVSTADFSAMRQRMIDASIRISATPITEKRTADDIREAEAFLDWLVKDHFIFLGARDYRYTRSENGELTSEAPIVVDGSGLGILRSGERHVLSRGAEPALVTPEIRAF